MDEALVAQGSGVSSMSHVAMEPPVSFEANSDAKELVRQAIDIVDLVGEYLPLRREGRLFKAICPWHDDSRPSLTVNQERQVYRCWVCNIGGDIFSFVMKQEGVTFPEAVQLLADKAGIKIAARPGASEDAAEQKRLYFQAMAWVEQQYHDHLLSAAEAEPARRYLAERGVTAESLRDWRLGAAPDRWEWIVEQARGTRYTPQVLEQVGVVGQRRSGNGYYDRFKGRVLFSIRDAQSRAVALGGRIMPGVNDENAAKYINSPETPLFSKSSMLYGLDRAKDACSKSRTALVMEGYTDVLIAHQFGFRNAVAVLGTALGERHIKLLRRFVDKIILVLDGDDAGRRRADEVIELFVAADMDLQILTLPDDLDPADFLLQRGAAEFETMLGNAVDALEHKFAAVSKHLTGESSVHAVQHAVEDILRLLAKAPVGAGDLASAAKIKEEQIVNRLSKRAGVSEDTLRKRLLDMRRNAGARRFDAVESAPVDEPPPIAIPEGRDKAERYLIQLVLAWPDLIEQIRSEVQVNHIWCLRRKRLFQAISDFADAGQPLSFERLLLHFDDADMKSLLVELDEEHRAMNRSNAERELRELLAWFRKDNRQKAEALAAVKMAGNRSAGNDLDTLQKLIERRRREQGMTSATDG